MSCGEHHNTPCTDVLSAVYLYLDNEDCNIERNLIQAHLDECGPCCAEFNLEETLKSLIARACGSEPAPVSIYERIVAQLANIQVEITRVQKHSP
jgi:mycothiol system anti-sigma-R factor